jgi:hypothetical protein
MLTSNHDVRPYTVTCDDILPALSLHLRDARAGDPYAMFLHLRRLCPSMERGRLTRGSTPGHGPDGRRPNPPAGEPAPPRLVMVRIKQTI